MTERKAGAAGRAYDLVAIDVDGTLLDSRNRLADDTLAAIRAVRARGIGVTVVSGRGLLQLGQWLERLELELPYIGSGGAFIADPLSGQVIEHSPLDRGVLATIVGLARAGQVGIFFEEPDRFVGEACPEIIRSIHTIAGAEVFVTPDILRDTTIAPTKMFMTGDHARLVPIEAEIRRLQLPVNQSFAAPIYLEVTRQGVNKGTALARLASHLGLPLERIAVIGDGGNDVSMFRRAGLAIAMGNAEPEVKAAADVVAPTNDDGGVAWALRELILKDVRRGPSPAKLGASSPPRASSAAALPHREGGA